MSPPDRYDPNSPNERPVPLPSAPRQIVGHGVVLQPPLSRRGKGPGIVIFLASIEDEGSTRKENGSGSNNLHKLEPDLITKWAEEGFSVLGVAVTEAAGEDLKQTIQRGVKQMDDCRDDTDKTAVRDKVAVVVFDPSIPHDLLSLLPIACLTLYPTATQSSNQLEQYVDVPRQCHLISESTDTAVDRLRQTHTYPTASGPDFALRSSPSFDYALSSLAHSRSVGFIKKHLGGPSFDLEAIWEEHTLYEFGERSVAKTMGTMVPEPYVNHLPTMTGGIGREQLTAFYRDHFIFSNPPSVSMQLVSRCVGHDRLVEEFIFSFVHDRMVDWILPGVPATGKKVSVPFTGAVSFRGDRLFYEHISWDQATVYRQIGLLPDRVPFITLDGRGGTVRLPTTSTGHGQEEAPARKLADPLEGSSNEMMGDEWGFKEAIAAENPKI